MTAIKTDIDGRWCVGADDSLDRLGGIASVLDGDPSTSAGKAGHAELPALAGGDRARVAFSVGDADYGVQQVVARRRIQHPAAQLTDIGGCNRPTRFGRERRCDRDDVSTEAKDKRGCAAEESGAIRQKLAPGYEWMRGLCLTDAREYAARQ